MLLPNGNIQQVSSKEEVVEVAQNGKGEVEQRVLEAAVGDGHPSLPDLVPPVNARDERQDSRGALVCLGKGGRLFHAKQHGDGVKVIGLAVLLPDFLFDKLVPVVDREAPA